MELVSTPWHIITAFFIFLLGLVISYKVNRFFCLNKALLLLLYVWHSIFSVVYSLYVINNGGDALMYYMTSFSSGVDFSFGTAGVGYITAFFTVLLSSSFLGASLGYHIFGFIGLMAFAASLRQVTYNKSKTIKLLVVVILFLPSVSFWSSSIGKDALSFMAMGLSLWAALNFERRKILMTFAILIMLIVRPHMAGMMVIGLGASIIFSSGLPLLQRMVFGVFSLVAVAILVPFALEYAGVGDNVSAESLESYIEQRQGVNLQGGSSLDIASMSLPMKLFTYLFRPLPFEAHSAAALAASLDNVILLFLFFAGGFALIKKKKSGFDDHNRTFLWVYALLAWIILAMTTANLGIAVRQKWMFAPVLIFLLFSVIGKPRHLPASARSQPAVGTSIVASSVVKKI